LHKDGSILTLLWNSATLFSSDGKTPLATIAQGHDITRERILEHERDTALLQIKQNLAYLMILNDEIRNPLNVILVYADMAEEEIIIEEIRKQIDNIDQIISLLDKRWIESEKILEYLRKHHQITFNTPDFQDVISDNNQESVQPFVIKDKNKTLLIEEIQAQLYTILDSLDALVYVADMDTYDLLFINQRGRNIFGNIIGKKCYQYLNKDANEPCPFCTNQKLIEEFGLTGVYHWEYQNPWNGRWYYCHDKIIKWTDGRQVRLEIATDITILKKLEYSLSQEKSLLSQTERIAHIGSWRISLKTGEVTISDEMYNLFGGKKRNVIPDLNEIIDAYIYPEDRELAKEYIRTIMTGNTSHEFDYRIVRPDGSLIWVHNQGEREIDNDGNVIAIIGFLEDITNWKEAEKKLRDSEQKFLTVFKTNPVPLALVSISDGTFTDVNEAFLKYTGYAYEDVIGKTSTDLELFVNDAEYQHFVSELQKKHFVEGMELQCRLKDGDFQLYRFSSKIIFIDGNPQILSAAENITQTKKAENQLYESEMRYKAITELSTDFQFSYIKYQDSPYSIDWLTGSVQEVTGYSIEEIKNIGCWRSLVHQDDYAIFDENVIETPPNECRKCSLRIITKQGDLKWFSVHVTHIPGNIKPYIERLYGGCKDITQYKKYEENLRKSEERYRLILESTNDGFWEWDFKSGRSVFGDRYYTMLGYSPGEFPATFRAWSSLIHPDDREQTISHLHQQIQEQVEFPQIEYRIKSKSGDWKWILGRGKAVGWDDEGNITHLMGSNTDITKLKRIEESLQESVENYRKLVHNVPDYIIVHREGIILFANEAAATSFGYLIEELIGTHLMNYLTSESKNIVNEMMQKRFTGSKIPPYEITILTKDGTPKISEVNGVLIQYEGKPASLNVLTDITEWKKTLKELHESEEKYRNIFDTINDGLHFHEVGPDGKPGKFLEVNDVACQMLQYSREELLQHGPLDFVTGYHNRPFQEIIDELIKTGYAIFETEHIRKDGIIIPVEINAHFVNLQGRQVTISVVRDISKRKQAEKALLVSERKFRELFEYANVGIGIAKAGMLLLVNSQLEIISGYNKEELLASPFSVFIHEDDRQMVMEMHQKREKGETLPAVYSFRMRKKDGATTWVEINSVIIDWLGTAVILFFLIDITERKQAEEALTETNEKIRLLTSLTRHDIFNQLSAIQLFQNMAVNSKEILQIYKYLSHAQEAVSRIEMIIGFTREYENFGITPSGWFCVYPIIESAIKEIVLGNVEIQVEIPSNLEIYADPIIRKIFTTMMENAVRHGITISNIRFSINITDTDLFIICEDDGVGIADDEKERIFDHGYGKHTGIGLYLARAILSITGLTIRETGIQGQGARFEIRVPSSKYRIHSERE
jgi:PAS domain S-box-containing protein